MATYGESANVALWRELGARPTVDHEVAHRTILGFAIQDTRADIGFTIAWENSFAADDEVARDVESLAEGAAHLARVICEQDLQAVEEAAIARVGQFASLAHVRPLARRSSAEYRRGAIAAALATEVWIQLHPTGHEPLDIRVADRPAEVDAVVAAAYTRLLGWPPMVVRDLIVQDTFDRLRPPAADLGAHKPLMDCLRAMLRVLGPDDAGCPEHSGLLPNLPRAPARQKAFWDEVEQDPDRRAALTLAVRLATPWVCAMLPAGRTTWRAEAKQQTWERMRTARAEEGESVTALELAYARRNLADQIETQVAHVAAEVLVERARRLARTSMPLARALASPSRAGREFWRSVNDQPALLPMREDGRRVGRIVAGAETPVGHSRSHDQSMRYAMRFALMRDLETGRRRCWDEALATYPRELAGPTSALQPHLDLPETGAPCWASERLTSECERGKEPPDACADPCWRSIERKWLEGWLREPAHRRPVAGWRRRLVGVAVADAHITTRLYNLQVDDRFDEDRERQAVDRVLAQAGRDFTAYGQLLEYRLTRWRPPALPDRLTAGQERRRAETDRPGWSPSDADWELVQENPDDTGSSCTAELGSEFDVVCEQARLEAEREGVGERELTERLDAIVERFRHGYILGRDPIMSALMTYTFGSRARRPDAAREIPVAPDDLLRAANPRLVADPLAVVELVDVLMAGSRDVAGQVLTITGDASADDPAMLKTAAGLLVSNVATAEAMNLYDDEVDRARGALEYGRLPDDPKLRAVVARALIAAERIIDSHDELRAAYRNRRIDDTAKALVPLWRPDDGDVLAQFGTAFEPAAVVATLGRDLQRDLWEYADAVRSALRRRLEQEGRLPPRARAGDV